MKSLLLHPFDTFSGKSALLIGGAAMGVTAVICAAGDLHLDGVLDIHAGGAPSNMLVAVTESVIDLLSIAVLCVIAGYLLTKNARIADVIGMQALARFPVLLNSLVVLLLINNKAMQSLLATYLNEGEIAEPTTLDTLICIGLILVLLALFVWTISLMFRAYVKSTGVQGARAVLSFVVILILAELISKVILANLPL